MCVRSVYLNYRLLHHIKQNLVGYYLEPFLNHTLFPRATARQMDNGKVDAAVA